MNKTELERTRRGNLNKLDQSFRDDRHINCVRFGKNESVKHKLAKCIAGILASEGVPIENMSSYMIRVNGIPIEMFNLSKSLENFIEIHKTKDNQDFIQEARFRKVSRVWNPTHEFGILDPAPAIPEGEEQEV